MKLPKLDMPTFKTTLPWSGQDITFRQYTCKEERILTTAAAGDDAEEAERAVIQTIENCCNVDVSTLHPVDVEWLFIKLRSLSVSPVIKVTFFPEKCTTSECPEEIDTLVNLDDAQCLGLDTLEQQGFTRRKGSWILMLTDEIGVQFRDLKESKDPEYHPILDNIQSIFDGETIYDCKQLEREHLIEWFDAMPVSQSEKIKSFFESQPYIEVELKAKCPHCKHEHTSTMRGLSSFFG